jgi:hypothetical protein
MFIRKAIKTAKITKKKYFSYQLVESVRTERGPRQRILLNLGSELDLNKEEKKLLANRIEEIISGINSLFTYSEQIESLANRFAKILLKKQSKISSPKFEEKEYHHVDVNTLKNEFPRTIGVETIA